MLPNCIFDEDMKPRDFAVYNFLVSRKDSINECWYSVEHIAEYCNISINTARRALHWLEENGYIEIKNLFSPECNKRTCIKFTELLPDINFGRQTIQKPVTTKKWKTTNYSKQIQNSVFEHLSRSQEQTNQIIGVPEKY